MPRILAGVLAVTLLTAGAASADPDGHYPYYRHHHRYHHHHDHHWWRHHHRHWR